MIGMGIEDLTALVAGKVMTPRATVLLFADLTIFMEELLRTFYKPGSRLVAGGHVTPEIELAANRAEVELEETLGVSSFSSNPESVLAALRSPHDLIYLANPNRVTGASFGVCDLQELARAIPQGTLFIDEYYYDHLGVTGFPLLDLLTNVVILRSLTAPFGISSCDAGFALASSDTISLIKHSVPARPLSSTACKSISVALSDNEALSLRLREIHEESLRLATALNHLRVQCRITATDFLLLRVADPTSVGNFLARYRIPVDNLAGYPQLENYLRYRIQPGDYNDRLIDAFKRMPERFCLMKSIDRRAVTMRRPAGNSSPRNPGKDVADPFVTGSFTPRRTEEAEKRRTTVRNRSKRSMVSKGHG